MTLLEWAIAADDAATAVFGPPWEDVDLFSLVLVFSLVWMFVAWVYDTLRGRAGSIRFAWAINLCFIAALYLVHGGGFFPRRLGVCSMMLYSGLYYAFSSRYAVTGEEPPRWAQRRAVWKTGKHFFRLKSPAINFLFLYQGNAVLNIFVFSFPLSLVSQNDDKTIITFGEALAHVIWFFSVLLVLKANSEISQFTSNSKEVLNTGLWRYSRHPNYFFEFCTWCSYAIYASTSVKDPIDHFSLLMVPLFAYVFMVYVNGLKYLELGSIERRGSAYKLYQRQTSMFIPWFPKQVPSTSTHSQKIKNS